MSMIKFGDTYYQGQKREVYLAGGRAIKDAEYKEINGKPHSSVTIIGAEKTADDTMFLSLEGWAKTSGVISAIKKGDFVLAYGTLNSREHNGKTYYSLNCDWIFPCCFEGDVTGAMSKAAEKVVNDFTPLTNEQDLPF